MKEFIKKPILIKDESYIIYSKNINEFIQMYKIEDITKIDINYLRQYYKLNKEKCINLIDELVLRGFSFEVQKESPLLPIVQFNISNLVVFVDNDKNNFQNINFSKLGISNFIDRFNVSSDYFLNFIKLDYFLYLNKNLSLDLLERELISNNIELISIDDLNTYEIAHEKYMIESIYKENTFNIFTKYCRENNIIYIEDLKGFDFNNLYQVERLGESKINKIKEKYIEITGNIDIYNVSLTESNYSCVKNISKYFEKCKIEVLSLFNVNDKIIEILKRDLSITLLSDLKSLKTYEILEIKGLGVSRQEKLKQALRKISTDPEELYLSVFEEIKSSENFDIYSMRSKKSMTLEEIGKIKGCTRERIRQIEKKTLSLFDSYLNLFEEFICSKLKNESCISYDDILNIYNGYDDYTYLKYALKNGDYDEYIYCEELDKFVLKDLKEKIQISLKHISSNMPEVFKSTEEIEYINESLEKYNLLFIELEEFINYLVNHEDYKKLNDYLWKGRDTLGKIYSFIIKDHFKNGIKLDEYNIDKIKHIVNLEFGINIESSNRSIIARISDECILCDRGTYIHHENINICTKLLNKIKRYIDNYESDSLVIADLFNVFEQDLNLYNISNRYFLHGILKYYYNEEYIFTKDRLSKGDECISTNKILENYLFEKIGAVSNDQIRRDFPGWTNIMFANSVSVNENIILWDVGSYIHKNNTKVSQEEKIHLKNILESKFEDNEDYINIYNIFKTLKLRMRALFKNNNIENPYNLYYLIESVFKDEYLFRRPMILRKGSNVSSIIDIFYEYIKDKEIIDFDDTVSYFISKNFRESTIYHNFRKISEDFIQISMSEYIRKEALELNEEIIQNIREFLIDKLKNTKYIGAFSIEDYSELPKLKYEWTPYMIIEIIKLYIPEFKIIEKSIKDRRNRRPIIVNSSSDMNKIEDVIVYIIENEYNDMENLTIKKISDYLNLNNIIVKDIPVEFYESDIVAIDEFGRISLREK